jgi:hypothetical protein
VAADTDDLDPVGVQFADHGTHLGCSDIQSDYEFSSHFTSSLDVLSLS